MHSIPREEGRRGALRIPEVRLLTAAVLPAAVLLLAGALAAPAEAAKPKKAPAEEATATTSTTSGKSTETAVKKSSGKAPAAAKSSATKTDSTAPKTTAAKAAAAAAPKSSEAAPKSGPAAPKSGGAAPKPAAAAPKPSAPASAVPPPPATGGIQRLSFPVKGMVCMLCTRGVEEAIKRLPGVATVSADLGSGRVDVVALEHHSLDIQQVRERVGKAGFPVNGEVDVEAAGRFEFGADQRIAFRPFGLATSWQVLESARLLALTRAHPGLRGNFVIGFRLHDKPPWKRTAIDITTYDATPVQRAAGGA